MIEAILLAAAATAATTPADKPQTAQQRFDAATVAADQGRCAEAIAEFDSLAAIPRIAANVGVASSIRARKGICLFRLNRKAEAQTALTEALRALPQTDPYRSDRLIAENTLGRMAELALSYELARTHYERALSEVRSPSDTILGKLAVARVMMFDEPEVAIRHAQDAVTLLNSTPKTSKDATAQVRTVYGRVLLNRGDARAALEELRSAVKLQGGLGTKVGLDEVVTRSDVAIAAMRAGNEEVAREYMAYTGAGRFEKAPFASGRDMAPPPCGGAAGIRPEDAAVIEFNIADTGEVTGSQPIWASRPGPMAREFARAVREWSWSSEDAKQIPAFFRLVTRVEMRCSNRTARPAPIDALKPAVSEWANANKLPPLDYKISAAASLPDFRKQLAARPSPLGLDSVPLLYALTTNAAASAPERAAWASQLSAIVRGAKAPVPVQAMFGIVAAQASSSDAKDMASRVGALLAEADIASHPEASATLALVLFDLDPRSRARIGLVPRLRAISGEPSLGERHPLKVGALVRLADLQAATGDIDGARASYAATGLDAQQCAVISPQAQMTRSGASSGDFPLEAMRWGFEGWVKFEADVAADGKTTNQRAIIAYPPFIFPEAALGIARGARYTQSYRPAGGPGCTGIQQNIVFRIP